MRLMYAIFLIFFISQSHACITQNSQVIAPSYNTTTKAPETSVKNWSNQYCILAESIPALRPSEAEWLKSEENSKNNNRRFQAWESLEYAQRETKDSLVSICNSSKSIVHIGQVQSVSKKEYVVSNLLYIAQVLTGSNFHSNMEQLVKYNKISLSKENRENIRFWCTAAGSHLIDTIRKLRK